MLNLKCSVGVAALILAASPLASARSMPDAKSVVASVRGNTVLLARYEARLGKTKGDAIAYLSELRPGVLAQSARYTAYDLDAGKLELARQVGLRKGEAMLVDATGRPVILVETGEYVELSLGVAVTPGEATSPTTATESPAEPEVVAQPVPLAAANLNAVQSESNSGNSPSGSRWLSLLTWGAPVGAIIALQNEGNSGSSTNVSPVPEPASMAALGLGAALIARRRRRS